ncbi:hypothetical protein [Novipirellula maiorica]|nr:hypothetical protein [Rhodopirellula maiorica]
MNCIRSRLAGSLLCLAVSVFFVSSTDELHGQGTHATNLQRTKWISTAKGIEFRAEPNRQWIMINRNQPPKTFTETNRTNDFIQLAGKDGSLLFLYDGIALTSDPRVSDPVCFESGSWNHTVTPIKNGPLEIQRCGSAAEISTDLGGNSI